MIRGIDCKVYRNSAALGTGYATPTWNLVDGVKDVDIKDSAEAYDTTTRRDLGIKTYDVTLDDVEITLMLKIPDAVLAGTTTAVATGDPDFDDWRAFNTAKNQKINIDLMFLTGTTATNGAEGLRGFFKIHDFSVSQQNSDGLFQAVTLKPSTPDSTTLATTATAVAMRHVRVAGGAPTYANWGSDTFA